ncbi:MAG: hypothetical protein FWH20_05895, partial [Oscillospiraceae bacterium]|nr:hypothetical protein [Oscillospiraceae bacterium]
RPEKDAPDREILARLSAACKVYDMDGADTAMEEIEAYKYTADDGLVEWLRQKVDVVDYPAIVQKLETN